jgi:transcription elongation factor B subunit 1
MLTHRSANVLEKVVDYFHYWYRNREKEDVPDWDFPVEMVLELLMAASYFGLEPPMSGGSAW